jgi:Lipocalin-like domain
MNKFIVTTTAFIALCSYTLSSCKKKTTTPVVVKITQQLIEGKQWKITSRVENGGTASLPTCASDDILEFKTNGKFNSLIAGTQCNPSEVDVMDGDYLLSADKTIITFTVPGFSYTGKLISVAENQMVIEFDLGPGFIIKDTFVPKL